MGQGQLAFGSFKLGGHVFVECHELGESTKRGSTIIALVPKLKDD